MTTGGPSEFDAFRDTYGDEVSRAVAFSGKGHDFFTRVKADYLLRLVGTDDTTKAVLDVGCGHGAIHPYLLNDRRGRIALTGVDTAASVIDVARENNPGVSYASYDGMTLPYADRTFDLAYAICVLHHVPPARWDGFVREMARVVKPGGTVAIFEHNPWNPLTRHVVKSCPLDTNAVLLGATTLRRILRRAGLVDVSGQFILFTPIEAAPFRWLDQKLGWLPLGAQHFATARVRA